MVINWRQFCPTLARRHLGISGDISCCHDWVGGLCYSHLMSRGQGCWKTSYNAQDSTSEQRIISLKRQQSHCWVILSYTYKTVFGRWIITRSPQLQEVRKPLKTYAKFWEPGLGKGPQFSSDSLGVHGQKRLKKPRKNKSFQGLWLNNLKWLFHSENYCTRRRDLFPRARLWSTLKPKQK